MNLFSSEQLTQKLLIKDGIFYINVYLYAQSVEEIIKSVEESLMSEKKVNSNDMASESVQLEIKYLNSHIRVTSIMIIPIVIQ